MSKQTRVAGSKFGGDWTKQKLFVIEEYLKKYASVLKNTYVKRIYIDAFAGSGRTEIGKGAVSQSFETTSLFDIFPEIEVLKTSEINQSTILDGSALLSLKYDFDEYYFLEIDEERIANLKILIQQQFPKKISKVNFIIGDSNQELKKLVNNITVRDRCLMFLDPYALELNWDTLENISTKTGIDLWYLFPLSALTRVLPKDGAKLNYNEEIVCKILGTDEWKNMLYSKSEQADFLGVQRIDRVAFDKLILYVISRFKSIFPTVSDSYAILRNDKKSPLFLLCFMMTNTSGNAINLANKLVDGIKKRLEKEYGKN